LAGIEVDVADLGVNELVHAQGSIEQQFEKNLMLHVAAVPVSGTVSKSGGIPGFNTHRHQDICAS
jgi:hypothetical protein